MSQKPSILWIDDESNRKTEKDNIEKLLNVDVYFVDVGKQDILKSVQTILGERQEPDIILIDHKLDKISDPQVIRTGTSVADIIRDIWKDCPIIAVTNVDIKSLGYHESSRYDLIVEFSNISSYYSTLSSIISTFISLKRKRPHSIDDLVKLLRCPKTDRERLELIMPDYIKNGFSDKSLLLNIYRWLSKVLFERPGFLLDRLWVATTLGIQENSFKKIETQFVDAKYAGIFADDHNPRWWQSRIKHVLFSAFPNSEEILPWKLGPGLEGISKKDGSKCYVCNEPFPETVGYTDETSNKRQPMHIECTIVHPKFANTLYFEELRMMKPAR